MNYYVSELNTLTKKYYDNIYTYCCRRINDADDAFEITQTVFLSLCKNYEKGDIVDVERWLMQAAKNQVSQYYRDKYKNSNMLVCEELEDNRITASYDFFENIIDEEFEKIIKIVMDSLSDEERRLYDSVYGENKIDYNAISNDLNISQATLRKRISRLKKKIKIKIKNILYCL